MDSAGYRRDVPNLVVLITDANADTDIIETIPAAEKLKGRDCIALLFIKFVMFNI